MEASPRAPPPDTPVEFVIKSTTTDAFSTRMYLHLTVRQVKEHLCKEYPGNPAPSQQTLISAGKVLKDDSVALSSVIKQDYDPAIPYTLHLVVKAAHTSSPPVQRSAQPATSMPTPVPTPQTTTPAPAPAPAQPSTSTPPTASPQPDAYDPTHFAAAHPQMAAAYTMYNAAFTAYQYATHTGAAPLPDHIQLASMPFIMPGAPQQQAPWPVNLPMLPQGDMAAVHLGYLPLVGAHGWADMQARPPNPPLPQQLDAQQRGFLFGRFMRQVMMQEMGGQGGAAPAAAAAGGAAAGPPGVRVRLLRVNLRVLIQAGFFLFLIYSNCPPARIVLLVVVAALLYLSTLPSVRRLLHRLITPAPPVPAPAPAAAPQQAEGAAGPPPAAPAAEPVRNVGLLYELRALVIGFFTSLLPGWNYNPEDAAAFAAAQELVAREEQGRHAHQD